MFNKKTKAAAWLLTMAMAFLNAVQPQAASHGFDPLCEEEKLILVLKNHKDKDVKTQTQIDEILEEIEEERAHWLICLWGDESGETWPKNGYPELYYLWLVDKLDLIYDALDPESELAFRCVRPFIEKLLDLVFTVNRKAYFCHENQGWTACQVRRLILG